MSTRSTRGLGAALAAVVVGIVCLLWVPSAVADDGGRAIVPYPVSDVKIQVEGGAAVNSKVIMEATWALAEPTDEGYNADFGKAKAGDYFVINLPDLFAAWTHTESIELKSPDNTEVGTCIWEAKENQGHYVTCVLTNQEFLDQHSNISGGISLQMKATEEFEGGTLEWEISEGIPVQVEKVGGIKPGASSKPTKPTKGINNFTAGDSESSIRSEWALDFPHEYVRDDQSEPIVMTDTFDSRLQLIKPRVDRDWVRVYHVEGEGATRTFVLHENSSGLICNINSEERDENCEYWYAPGPQDNQFQFAILGTLDNPDEQHWHVEYNLQLKNADEGAIIREICTPGNDIDYCVFTNDLEGSTFDKVERTARFAQSSGFASGEQGTFALLKKTEGLSHSGDAQYSFTYKAVRVGDDPQNAQEHTIAVGANDAGMVAREKFPSGTIIMIREKTESQGALEGQEFSGVEYTLKGKAGTLQPDTDGWVEFAIEKGTVLELIATNTYDPLGQIVLEKLDATSKQPLEGVNFQLWIDVDGDGELNKLVDEKIGEAQKTNSVGKITWSDLKLGKYFIEETATLPGYVFPEVNITLVELTKDHTEAGLPTASKKIENERRMGTVQWQKVAAGVGDADSRYLAGSEWELTGPNNEKKTVADCVGNSVAECAGTLDQDPAAGRIKVSDLEWGQYTLKEVKAPVGYQLWEESRTFTVGPDVQGNIEIDIDLGEIENQQQLVPEIPLTGGVGRTQIALVAGTCLMAALSIALWRRYTTAQ